MLQSMSGIYLLHLCESEFVRELMGINYLIYFRFQYMSHSRIWQMFFVFCIIGLAVDFGMPRGD